jgi:K+-transporting ATPase KdpF subunit
MGSSCFASGSEGEFIVPILYVIGGILSLGLLVYLFIALLKPEALS